MTNETTASQPKSIGDGAMRKVIQDAVADNMTSLYLCSRHQSAWGAGTMGLDDFSPAGDSDDVITNITDAVMSAIHKEIEFRAPAAQASATIQAAPPVKFTYKGTDGKYLDSQDWCVDNEEVGSFASAPIYRDGKVVALVFSDAPNFEEEIAENCRLLTHVAQLADSATLAAPMVADPAGVDREMPEGWADTPIINDTEILLIWEQSVARGHMTQTTRLDFARLIEALVSGRIAATVKAVPSEALDDAQRERIRDGLSIALGQAMDCTRVWSAWGVGTMSEDDFQLLADNDERLDELVDAVAANLAAPLADKTGGAQ